MWIILLWGWILGDVSITGNCLLTDSVVYEILDPLRGEVFDTDRFRGAVEKILELYGEKGYPFAEIGVEDVKVEADTIFMVLRIREGRLRYVRRVEVEGMKLPRWKLCGCLRRGAEFRLSGLRKLQRRVMRMGVATDVGVKLVPIGEDSVDVVLRVRPQRVRFYGYVGGWDDANVRLSSCDFWGRAERIEIDGRKRGEYGSLYILYREPILVREIFVWQATLSYRVMEGFGEYSLGVGMVYPLTTCEVGVEFERRVNLYPYRGVNYGGRLNMRYRGERFSVMGKLGCCGELYGYGELRWVSKYVRVGVAGGYTDADVVYRYWELGGDNLRGFYKGEIKVAKFVRVAVEPYVDGVYGLMDIAYTGELVWSVGVGVEMQAGETGVRVSVAFPYMDVHRGKLHVEMRVEG